ncbi:MAG: insulinase family protein [Candidatus Muirbacterium halophilum]|nr:insulinase family protein [Candidatus Muirbacterium halophilum]
MVKIKKINDITVIYEKLPYVKSISIGVWVKSGTCYEGRFSTGISHFTEHMLFKGTKKRTAKDIAEEFDRVGGYLNAFSSKEYTCYYARLIDEHLELAVEALADITINSTFEPEELEKEREVVIEEIMMYEDNPDELVNDMINEIFWDKHPFGRNILGSIESVNSITRDNMVDFVGEHYTAPNLIISIAGNFKEIEFKKLIAKYFSDISRKNTPKIIIPETFKSRKPVFIKKDIKQTHFCLATTGPSQVNQDKFAFGILSSILGGGMSSRLFQKIREKFGLVYTIYSYTQSHANSGMFVVYFACNEKNTMKVIDLTMQEMINIMKNTITKDELIRGKEQLKGNIVLSLENTSARMRRQASSLIYYDRLIPIEEVVSSIDNVSIDDIVRVSEKYIDFKKMTFCAAGSQKIKFNEIRSNL